MDARFISNPYMNSKGNEYRFTPRYSSNGSHMAPVCAVNTIDTILGKKFLAHTTYSSGMMHNSNAGAADVVCGNFGKYERLHNEFKKICTASSVGSGYIRYLDTGLSFTELKERIDIFKQIGLVKNVIFSNEGFYLSLVPEAVSFLTKDFAVIYTVNMIQKKGAVDIRYNCPIRDVNSGKLLNIDIVYQRENGGHVEFIMVILNSHLHEYANANNEKHYRKIIEAADRLKGLTLIVSPSVDVFALRSVLEMYTKYPTKIIKLTELEVLR